MPQGKGPGGCSGLHVLGESISVRGCRRSPSQVGYREGTAQETQNSHAPDVVESRGDAWKWGGLSGWPAEPPNAYVSSEPTAQLFAGNVCGEMFSATDFRLMAVNQKQRTIGLAALAVCLLLAFSVYNFVLKPTKKPFSLAKPIKAVVRKDVLQGSPDQRPESKIEDEVPEESPQERPSVTESSADPEEEDPHPLPPTHSTDITTAESEPKVATADTLKPSAKPRTQDVETNLQAPVPDPMPKEVPDLTDRLTLANKISEPDPRQTGGIRGEIFVRLDENGDLRLEPQEMPVYYREKLLACDLDNDGKINFAEFEKAIDKLPDPPLTRTLTKALSGLLNPPEPGKEIPTYEPVQQRRQGQEAPGWFTSYDRSKDGHIAVYEWPAGRLNEFRALDANNDGFITLEEARKAEALKHASDTERVAPDALTPNPSSSSNRTRESAQR